MISFTMLIALVTIIMVFFATVATTHAATPAQAALGNTIPLMKAGQSNISQSIGKLAHYSPKTLSCTRVGGSCSITIKNTTTASQSVTQKGNVLFVLAPMQSKSITYTTAGTFTYSLSSNPKSKLTVTVV